MQAIIFRLIDIQRFFKKVCFFSPLSRLNEAQITAFCVGLFVSTGRFFVQHTVFTAKSLNFFFCYNQNIPDGAFRYAQYGRHCVFMASLQF
jgi:hypothetical protein